MEQIKKKHHFVWKEYLRSWAEQDDVINAYLKKQNKAASTNLINVAKKDSSILYTSSRMRSKMF